MNLVLTFDTDGSARCLHSDAIPLQSLGTLVVRRATTIEFNHTRQKWEVEDRDGEILFRSPSRSICLAWEHQHLNR